MHGRLGALQSFTNEGIRTQNLELITYIHASGRIKPIIRGLLGNLPREFGTILNPFSQIRHTFDTFGLQTGLHGATVAMTTYNEMWCLQQAHGELKAGEFRTPLVT